MTLVVVDATSGNDAADRARAYVALLGMLGFEVEPPALGSAIEKWATFMSGSHVSKRALLATLRVHRERCPVVSLIRACVILGLDLRDVTTDAAAAA